MAPARRMTHSNREVYPIMFLLQKNLPSLKPHLKFYLNQSI